MKQVIKKLFAIFGIGIHKLNPIIKNKGSLNGTPKISLPETGYSAFQHNSLENVNKIFSDPVQMDKYLEPLRLKFYEEITQFAISKGVKFDNKKIVDVGCGTGHLLLNIKSNSTPLSITGLDFSQEAINFSKKIQPNESFYVYDLYEKFEKKFDIILCTEVLEHLLHPEIAISNLKEMMLPDSTCIITVPNGRTDTFSGHINFWSPESWSKFINDEFKGYQIETGLIDNNTVNYSIIKKPQF